jgi:hypothetical protein
MSRQWRFARAHSKTYPELLPRIGMLSKPLTDPPRLGATKIHEW